MHSFFSLSTSSVHWWVHKRMNETRHNRTENVDFVHAPRSHRISIADASSAATQLYAVLLAKLQVRMGETVLCECVSVSCECSLHQRAFCFSPFIRWNRGIETSIKCVVAGRLVRCGSYSQVQLLLPELWIELKMKEEKKKTPTLLDNPRWPCSYSYMAACIFYNAHFIPFDFCLFVSFSVQIFAQRIRP